MHRRYKAAAVAMAAVWIVTAVCLLSGGERETPQGGITVTEKNINSGSEKLTIDIRLPVVSGFRDPGFERSLNAMIETQVFSALRSAEKAADEFWSDFKARGYEPWPYTFYAEYDVMSAEGIFSLRVTTLLYTGGPGMPETVCYNADTEKNALLTLGDLFKNEAYKKKINAVIMGEMSKDPDRYLGDEPFSGVSGKTKFFVREGKLYITFAKYEVASGMTGEPEFLIPTEVIRGVLRREYRGIFS